MHYVKYHGLGNDYLMIRPGDVGGDLNPGQIRLICDRNYGVGSDGILASGSSSTAAAVAHRLGLAPLRSRGGKSLAFPRKSCRLPRKFTAKPHHDAPGQPSAAHPLASNLSKNSRP